MKRLKRKNGTYSIYQCVKWHRKMWRWLATQEEYVEKSDYLVKFMPNKMNDLDCFACLYSFNIRKNEELYGCCLFLWPSDKGFLKTQKPHCEHSYYRIWRTTKYTFNEHKRQKMAMLIAGLPLARWNYGTYSW